MIILWNKQKGTGGSGGSAVSGSNLYDIKTMANAIADKGWAFTCKSTRQDLAQADVPTIYNDIEYKYLNCDKVPASSPSSLGGFAQNAIDLDDTYLYCADTNTWKLKRTRLDSLPVTNWETLVNSKSIKNTTYKGLCVGNKILIACFSGSNNSTDICVYKKSDWSLLKTYNHTNNNGMDCYCSSIYVNGTKKFVVGYKDTEQTINSSYMVFIEDNDTLQETKYTLSYQRNCIPVYINGYYVFMARNTESSKNYFLRTQNFVTIDVCGYYQNFSADTVAPIYKADNKLFTYKQRVSYDNGATWAKDTSVPNIDTNVNTNSGCQKENSFYITQGKNLLFTDTLTTFTTLYTDSNNLGHFVLANDSGDMIFLQKNYSLSFLGYDKVVYTDNYTINGTTVSIQYYKYEDFKICIADENGTDDVNLDTVFGYLGYLNYWRLDRANQTITLPRNSNLYSMMFVGDDYEDTTIGITGNTTRLLPQAEEVTISGATASVELKGNKIYSFDTALTSLTLSSVETSVLETVLYFTTDSTITFTDNSGVRWGGGNEQPTLEPNTVYCISIRNGLAEIDTFGTVS